jgi:hypothetical protein
MPYSGPWMYLQKLITIVFSRLYIYIYIPKRVWHGPGCQCACACVYIRIIYEPSQLTSRFCKTSIPKNENRSIIATTGFTTIGWVKIWRERKFPLNFFAYNGVIERIKLLDTRSRNRRRRIVFKYASTFNVRDARTTLYILYIIPPLS